MIQCRVIQSSFFKNVICKYEDSTKRNVNVAVKPARITPYFFELIDMENVKDHEECHEASSTKHQMIDYDNSLFLLQHEQRGRKL